MKRRHFLKASLASLGAIASSHSLAAQLQLANALSANRFSDYKAIVCIFLYGGHDSFNLFVPTDDRQYADYARTRQLLSYAQHDLVSLNQEDAYPIGVNSRASAFADLFNQGRASIVSNMGPMREPATRQMLINNENLAPPQLFSHNDQQSLWQNALMDTKAPSGWGGRMADLLMDAGSSGSAAVLPMSFSLGGTNLFQSGVQAKHYVMNSDGVEAFGALDPRYDYNDTRIQYHLRLLEAAQHSFAKNYSQKVLSARNSNAILSDALSAQAHTTVDYGIEAQLAEQLKMIARLISAQSMLGQSRQIFFASLGGFDTHDNQAVLLPQLQEVLTRSMAGFDADLRARGIDDNVVTFTQSEFGRTLTSNGDGTDHGWAGHQLILGTPIAGARVFGHMPEQTIGTEDDLFDGRIIPTTSIEQFGSQIAQWYGLEASEINEVFPNLSRFDTSAFNLFS
ncbi:DUF1501 domain-containing protein [Ningiella sp. W23]|uniref:DUF1501 domain-containing protein n=1 Tax=Ningiella sp. W23 TaxID=3023715 RepID=UPI003757512D